MPLEALSTAFMMICYNHCSDGVQPVFLGALHLFFVSINVPDFPLQAILCGYLAQALAYTRHTIYRP